MPVVLLGTLDTKGSEYQFVRGLLHAAQVPTLVIDAGVSQPLFVPDIGSDEVFRAAGTSLSAVAAAGDRGQAVQAAARGAARIVSDLHRQGKVDGLLSLGGSAGTTIGTAAMRALPFGVPKLMVSTLASGQVKQWVGVRDILMLHSVVDLSGLNRISRVVLANAAHAMIGMHKEGMKEGMREGMRDEGRGMKEGMRDEGRGMREEGGEIPALPHPSSLIPHPSFPPHPSSLIPHPSLITATMFGVTTPCVNLARQRLEGKGYEVLVFHATGTGGLTMESFIADGLIHGVLDITTTELADELVGGILTAGRDRLTAAGLHGLPQVISVGALDMVNFGPPETVPEKFKGRRFYQHNPAVTLMRTTPQENDRLGKEIAEKASAARGPTAVMVPLRGVSAIDREGQPFWWPEADQALFQSLRNWISPSVQLVELDLHINDPEFARAAADLLLRFLACSQANRAQ